MSKHTALFKGMIVSAWKGDLAARQHCKDVLITCINNETGDVPDYVLLKLSECLVECFLEEQRKYAEGN